MSSIPMTFRLKSEDKQRLEKIAEAEGRAVSHLIVEALTAYMDTRSARQKFIDKAFEESAEDEFFALEEVMPWFYSLGTDDELPEPGMTARAA